MSEVRTHKDLDIWKMSIDLVKDIYALTESFPKDGQFGLTSQLRRATVLVPSNIAEGSARNGNKEFIQFCYISGFTIGSENTDYHCKRIELYSNQTFK